MNILAVDTAGKTAGVALLQDDRLLYEVYLDGGMTHSETLMPMIDTCLKMCGLTCADIDLYAVNARPRAPPCQPWTRWVPPTPARAPCSAHWMPAAHRYTAQHLTLPPMPACWTMMPGRLQIWLIL